MRDLYTKVPQKVLDKVLFGHLSISPFCFELLTGNRLSPSFFNAGKF